MLIILIKVKRQWSRDKRSRLINKYLNTINTMDFQQTKLKLNISKIYTNNH